MFTDDITRPDFSILIYPVITMDKGYTHQGTRNNLIGGDEIWYDKNVTVNEFEMKQNLLKDTRWRNRLPVTLL